MVAVEEAVPAQLVVARGPRQLSLQPGMQPIPQVSLLRQARSPARRAPLVGCRLQARRAQELRLLAAPCSRELGKSSRSPRRRLSAPTTPQSRFRRSFDRCSVSQRHYRVESDPVSHRSPKATIFVSNRDSGESCPPAAMTTICRPLSVV